MRRVILMLVEALTERQDVLWGPMNVRWGRACGAEGAHERAMGWGVRRGPMNVRWGGACGAEGALCVYAYTARCM